MARNNGSLDRRKFLGSIASAGALTGTAGMASASRGGSTSSGLLTVKNGQLKLNVKDDRGKVVSQDAVLNGDIVTASDGDFGGFDENRFENVVRETMNGRGPITGEDAAVLLAKGVEKLNELAGAGMIEFGRQNGQVVVTMTSQAIKQATAGSTTATVDSNPNVPTLGCGVTEYERKSPGLFNPKFRHDLKTNDEDSEMLAHELGDGAIVSGLLMSIFGLCSTTANPTCMIGALLCAILTAVQELWSREIGYKNEGCGVITNVNHIPVPPGPIPPTSKLHYNFYVESQ